MHYSIPFIIGALFLGGIYFAQEPLLGAVYIRSIQLAPDPDSGECLETDGTDNVWDTCAAGGGGGGGGQWTITAGAIYNSTTSDSVWIGQTSSTTRAKLEVNGFTNIKGAASSTLFSSLGPAYFGSSATSSFNTAGALTLSTALAVTSGGTGATSLNDLITLTTHTAGNYIATLADDGQTTVTVTNGSGEGGAATLRVIDVVCTGCLGATEIAGLGTADLSGLDISDDTNLTAGDNLTLTDDDLDLDTTLTGLTRITVTNASTTYFTAASYASTSKFFADGLVTCNTESMLTWAAGVFGCETDTAGAGGGSWPFTPTTYNGQAAQSTSTLLWLTGSPLSLAASTTHITFASTTALTLSGSLYTTALTGILQGKGATAVSAITDSSTAGQVLRVTGASAYAWGALDLDDADAFTGTLPVANTQLTGGVGLTLTTDDMACDTASGSVFGCLASADWTIFNNKSNTPSKWATSTLDSTVIYAALGEKAAVGTTTAFWGLTVASTTGPQIGLTDGTAGNFAWTLRSINNILYIATSTATATSTKAALTLQSGIPSLLIGTTSSLTTATTTIFMEKLQFQGSNAAGAQTCAYITAANAWAINAGVCP